MEDKSQEQQPRSSPVILVVEDDVGITKLMRTTFRMLGYKATFATSKSEATDIIKSGEFKPDIVITDRSLDPNNPNDISGLDIAKLAKETFSEVAVYVYTSRPSAVTGGIQAEFGIDKVLAKGQMTLADWKREIDQAVNK